MLIADTIYKLYIQVILNKLKTKYKSSSTISHQLKGLFKLLLIRNH